MLEINPDEVRVGDTLRVRLDLEGLVRATSCYALGGGAEDLTIAALATRTRRTAYCTVEEVVAKFTDGRCAVLNDYTYYVVEPGHLGLPADIVPNTRLLPEVTTIQLKLEDFE